MRRRSLRSPESTRCSMRSGYDRASGEVAARGVCGRTRKRRGTSRRQGSRRLICISSTCVPRTDWRRMDRRIVGVPARSRKWNSLPRSRDTIASGSSRGEHPAAGRDATAFPGGWWRGQRPSCRELVLEGNPRAWLNTSSRRRRGRLDHRLRTAGDAGLDISRLRRPSMPSARILRLARQSDRRLPAPARQNRALSPGEPPSLNKRCSNRRLREELEVAFR